MAAYWPDRGKIMETFTAFVRRGVNGAPDIQWQGLTYGQARWRYKWIQRNWHSAFDSYREYGYGREPQGAA
jgi:hypothetical protein